MKHWVGKEKTRCTHRAPGPTHTELYPPTLSGAGLAMSDDEPKSAWSYHLTTRKRLSRIESENKFSNPITSPHFFCAVLGPYVYVTKLGRYRWAYPAASLATPHTCTHRARENTCITYKVAPEPYTPSYVTFRSGRSSMIQKANGARCRGVVQRPCTSSRVSAGLVHPQCCWSRELLRTTGRTGI